MNRWLVALLVVLALVILVSPGIVGRLAERNVEDSIQWAASENPGISISTETFERGWFTSEGRHRVVLDGGRFRDAGEVLQDSSGSPGSPSLIIDTRIDHGLLPLSSLKPGLASSVSTFQVDPGNGELIDLPGTLRSNVSFSGAMNSHFLADAGSFQLDGASLEWEGVDLSVVVDRNAGKFSAHGTISPLSIDSADGSLDIGQVSIDAEQTISEHGLYVGPVKLSIGAITGQEDGATFSIGGMQVEGDSSISDGRINGGGRLQIEDVDVPGFGEIGVLIDVAMSGFDAAALGAINQAAKDAQASADPEAALQALMVEIEGDLQQLASKGGSLSVNRLDVSLPQGQLATTLNVEVAESAADASFDWSTVLLNTTASLSIRVPSSLYDMASLMNPQAGSLVAMGILVKDGDDYILEAEYAQGLVNVNGAPMPLPIPGM